jgi:hypothetical protein
LGPIYPVWDGIDFGPQFAELRVFFMMISEEDVEISMENRRFVCLLSFLFLRGFETVAAWQGGTLGWVQFIQSSQTLLCQDIV